MRILWLLLLFLATFSVAQLPYADDPAAVSKLRPGELVRVYKRGGLTPHGPYRALIVVRGNGLAIAKTATISTSRTLDAKEMKELRAAIAAYDQKHMTSKPNPHGHPPSAADGTDYFLSIAKGTWSNTTHWHPPAVKLLDLLNGYEQQISPLRAADLPLAAARAVAMLVSSEV